MSGKNLIPSFFLSKEKSEEKECDLHANDDGSGVKITGKGDPEAGAHGQQDRQYGHDKHQADASTQHESGHGRYHHGGKHEKDSCGLHGHGNDQAQGEIHEKLIHSDRDAQRLGGFRVKR